MLWWKRLKKDNKEKEKQINEDLKKEGGLEKHDMKAMIFSALLVFVPVCLGILIVISLIAMLILGLF